MSRCAPILKNLFLKEIKKLHMEAGRKQNYLTNIKIEAPLLVKRLSKVAQNARNRRFLVKERKNALPAEYIPVPKAVSRNILRTLYAVFFNFLNAFNR